MIDRLNEFHLEDMNNPDHPSVFVRHEEYFLFIYRMPVRREKELVVASSRFALFGEEAIRYDEASGGIVELKGGVQAVYGLVDRQTDGAMKLLEEYIGEVSDLEEALLERKTASGFMERWFYLKKDLNRMERLIIPAITTIDELIRELSKKSDHLTVGFQDIKEHLERTHRFALLNIKKLEEIYSLHISLINEKMNRTVYMLAIVSAIFLPLNFIVSFFGINTGGLFFTQSPDGTMKVVWLIVGVTVSVLALLFIFRKKVFH